jgi:linoleoyl-CoA desaturase
MEEVIYKYGVKDKGGFYAELNERVETYFELGKLSRYATLAMFIKIVLSLFLYLFFYCCILFSGGSLTCLVICCICMGIAGSLIFFNVVHDASHNSLFRKKKYNKWLSFSFDFIGGNSYIWNVLHNGLHHTFTSIENIEILTDVYPIIRVSENQPHRKIYKYQHLYAPIVYSLFSLFWLVYIDFDLFLKRRLGNFRSIRHPLPEWIILFAGKIGYVFFILILPKMLLDLSWGEVVAGFFIMQCAMGSIISVISAINHFPEGSSFMAPDESGTINTSKKVYELEATTDFSPGSRLASWFFGGFNTHAAHHMFPNVCHIHYRRLTELVKEIAPKYNISYKEKTLFGAVISHFKHLKKMSKKNNSFSDNTLAANE